MASTYLNARILDDAFLSDNAHLYVEPVAEHIAVIGGTAVEADPRAPVRCSVVYLPAQDLVVGVLAAPAPAPAPSVRALTAVAWQAVRGAG